MTQEQAENIIAERLVATSGDEYDEYAYARDLLHDLSIVSPRLVCVVRGGVLDDVRTNSDRLGGVLIVDWDNLTAVDAGVLDYIADLISCGHHAAQFFNARGRGREDLSGGDTVDVAHEGSADLAGCTTAGEMLQRESAAFLPPDVIPAVLVANGKYAMRSFSRNQCLTSPEDISHALGSFEASS